MCHSVYCFNFNFFVCQARDLGDGFLVCCPVLIRRRYINVFGWLKHVCIKYSCMNWSNMLLDNKVLETKRDHTEEKIIVLLF